MTGPGVHVLAHASPRAGRRGRHAALALRPGRATAAHARPAARRASASAPAAAARSAAHAAAVSRECLTSQGRSSSGVCRYGSPPVATTCSIQSAARRQRQRARMRAAHGGGVGLAPRGGPRGAPVVRRPPWWSQQSRACTQDLWSPCRSACVSAGAWLMQPHRTPLPQAKRCSACSEARAWTTLRASIPQAHVRGCPAPTASSAGERRRARMRAATRAAAARNPGSVSTRSSAPCSASVEKLRPR